MRTPMGNLDAGRERRHFSIRGPTARVDDLGVALASLVGASMTIARYPTGKAALMVTVGDASAGRLRGLVRARSGLSLAIVSTPPAGVPFRFSDIRHVEPPDVRGMGGAAPESSDGPCAWYVCVDTQQGAAPAAFCYHYLFDGYPRRYYPTARAGLTYAYLPADSRATARWLQRHGSYLRRVPGLPNAQQTPTLSSQGAQRARSPEADA